MTTHSMMRDAHDCNEVLAALEAEVNDLLQVALPAIQEYGHWQKLQLRASRIATMLVRIGNGAEKRMNVLADKPHGAAMTQALEAERRALAECHQRLAAMSVTIDSRVRRAAMRLGPDGRS